MSEEIEDLKKEVKALRAEIADIKSRCILKEEPPVELTVTSGPVEETPIEAEEAESATESTAGEEQAAEGHTEETEG